MTRKYVNLDISKIEIDLSLTTLKPLHAQLLVNMYNFFTRANTLPIITGGWKKAAIAGLLDETTSISDDDPLMPFIHPRNYYAVKYMHHLHGIFKNLLNS